MWPRGRGEYSLGRSLTLEWIVLNEPQSVFVIDQQLGGEVNQPRIVLSILHTNAQRHKRYTNK